MTLRPLHAAVGAWTPGAEISGDPLTVITATWPSIVGPDVAKNSRPLEISRGSLIVLTRSSAWSQQLSFLSERIVAAVAEKTGKRDIEGIRFRVGRLAAAGTRRRAQRDFATPVRSEPREAVATLAEAVQRFRSDVTDVQRAKVAAGWKQCEKCGTAVSPSAGSLCVACVNARSEARTASVARLLFDVPWLGYDGIAEVVDGLTTAEYESIRTRLLSRWWDALSRVRRSGRGTMTPRERLIASSYVLLKSGLDPERIAPAVVRDLLGEELHDIIYGSENN
ncbi:MAG: DUF721 domain-containing protein [Candidatus Eremiobacteraeota bacterium]|nr:DUF721 domain-containing protein [Candidatus Eremiobacteraeota bacterium]